MAVPVKQIDGLISDVSLKLSCIQYFVDRESRLPVGIPIADQTVKNSIIQIFILQHLKSENCSQSMHHKNINIDTDFLNGDQEVQLSVNSPPASDLLEHRMENAAIFLENHLTTLMIRRLIVGFNCILKARQRTPRIFNRRKQGNDIVEGSELRPWIKTRSQHSPDLFSNRTKIEDRRGRRKEDRRQLVCISSGSQESKFRTNSAQRGVDQASAGHRTVNQRIRRLECLINNIKKQKEINEPMVREKVAVEQQPSKQQSPSSMLVFELRALRTEVQELRKVNEAILAQSCCISRSHSKVGSRTSNKSGEGVRLDQSKYISNLSHKESRGYPRTTSNFLRTHKNSKDVHNQKEGLSGVQNRHKTFSTDRDHLDQFIDHTLLKHGPVLQMLPTRRQNTGDSSEFCQPSQPLASLLDGHQAQSKCQGTIKSSRRIRENSDTTSEEIWKLLGVTPTQNPVPVRSPKDCDNQQTRRYLKKQVHQNGYQPKELATKQTEQQRFAPTQTQSRDNKKVDAHLQKIQINQQSQGPRIPKSGSIQQRVHSHANQNSTGMIQKNQRVSSMSHQNGYSKRGRDGLSCGKAGMNIQPYPNNHFSIRPSNN